MDFFEDVIAAVTSARSTHHGVSNSAVLAKTLDAPIAFGRDRFLKFLLGEDAHIQSPNVMLSNQFPQRDPDLRQGAPRPFGVRRHVLENRRDSSLSHGVSPSGSGADPAKTPNITHIRPVEKQPSQAAPF